MALIKTKKDLQEYRDRIERQKHVLNHSLIFDDSEKQRVAEIYNGLLAVCDNILSPNKTKATITED